MAIELTCACEQYDRTVALQDGTVQPDGARLNFMIVRGDELFRRQGRHAEFDISEFSLSTYTLLRDRGDSRLIAIPVFTSRRFRHSFIFVNRKAGIREPQDLVGKRVGVQEYQQTAAVWTRGILQDYYGVAASQMDWYFGGYDFPLKYEERIPLELPPEVSVTRISDSASLGDQLASGEIDALIGATVPRTLWKSPSEVARLFPEYRNVEAAYFHETGIFPIMHLVVLKREVYERYPWIAVNLFKAFVQAKRVGYARLLATGWLYTSLPWLDQHLEDDLSVIGEDPFPYGLNPNYKALDTLLRYSSEQGLTARRIVPEELFVEETIDISEEQVASTAAWVDRSIPGLDRGHGIERTMQPL